MAATNLAFAVGATTSSFTASAARQSATSLRPLHVQHAVRPARISMADEKKPLFSNPFAKKKANQNVGPTSAFMKPQAGDAGYEAPAKSTVVAQTGGKKLHVLGNFSISNAKRGIDLLREDLFKSGPEAAGVGRQDASAVMKPLAGEPGYKAAAYQQVKVSDLGISPFPDDANAVGKVGGVEAVKKAALDVKEGKKTADDIKKSLLNIMVEKEPEVFDIPDYLKPIPEDTPRKGLTWKNYVGR